MKMREQVRSRKMKTLLLLITAMATCATAVADLSEISNYREYSKTLSSSGQPNKEQLQEAWVESFQRVVYLAFSDHDTSLENEDRIVKELGMDYINIPVNWGSPTKNDFYLFAGALQREPDRKTLVHCQVNFRASSFSFLYRVIYQDVAVAEAKKDMNSVWTPNTVWTAFILDLLEENDISPGCEDCDWTPQQQHH
jgi:protein tyrosine phosphatase (PTP) superfamily phosphohydrolase (DUF442 family)